MCPFSLLFAKEKVPKVFFFYCHALITALWYGLVWFGLFSFLTRMMMRKSVGGGQKGKENMSGC